MMIKHKTAKTKDEIRRFGVVVTTTVAIFRTSFLQPYLMYNLLSKSFTSFNFSSPKGRVTMFVAPLR